LIQRSNSILKTIDPSLSQLVADELQHHGVEVVTGVDVDRIEQQGERLRVADAQGFERLTLGTTAHKQGRVAGENAIGGNRQFQGSLGTQVVKIDGLEAIAKIRKIPLIAHTQIIPLTALAMPGDRERCLAGGANEYLAKPAKLKQVRETIQRLIGLSVADQIQPTTICP
jgi:CheY-like chemotaxis protein